MNETSGTPQVTGRGNTYYVLRHGEAEQNVKNIVSSGPSDDFPLTEKGVLQVRESVTKLAGKGISKIYASPIRRARESAIEASTVLGIEQESIVFDDRLQEFDFGSLNGKPFTDFIAWRSSIETIAESVPGGESYLEAKRRFGAWLYETDATLSEEKVLVVTHGIGVESLLAVVEGMTNEETHHFIRNHLFEYACVRSFVFEPRAVNQDYERVE